MDLKREIAPADGVEKIEADGKLSAEPGDDGFAEQRLGMREDQVDGGDLDAKIAEAEQKTVFLGHAVEAPCMIGSVVDGNSADALHPVPAPRAGIEERNHAKGPLHNSCKAAAEDVSGNGFGLAGFVRV